MGSKKKELMANTTNMIEARNMSFDYFKRDENGEITGKERALDGIDLEVKHGQFIAILGSNGSGKSTLAKNINAILNPSEGTLYVDGIDVSNDELIWDVRKSAGMVFQNPDNQIIASVVEEDVAFGPENMGISPKDIIKRVEECLKAVGMFKFRKASPNHLSGGQKQRIAIAGIMAMKPKCIVLDEPTAMLDPSGRRDVIKTITKLNKEEGITILLITHYMDEVVNADKVFVMADHKIKMHGTPREIFENAKELEELKLDVPYVTRLAVALRDEGIELPADILTREELVAEIMKVKAKQQ